MPVIEPLNQTILRGARIVTPAGTLAATDLLIEDELISAIRPPLANVSRARVIDLSQLTLYPGFIELHIHGAVGVDTMTAGSEDLTRAGEFLTRHGVTGWLPTLVPSPPEDYERAVKSIEKLVAKGSAPDAEPIRNPCKSSASVPVISAPTNSSVNSPSKCSAFTAMTMGIDHDRSAPANTPLSSVNGSSRSDILGLIGTSSIELEPPAHGI